MPDYGKMLDFHLLNQEVARLAFETAKHSPYLFMLSPFPNPPVEPWQPLLFGNVLDPAPVVDTPMTTPDVNPGARDQASEFLRGHLE
jgi:hypothetical protein